MVDTDLYPAGPNLRSVNRLEDDAMGQVEWVPIYSDALEKARIARRPLFADFFHPG